MLLAASKGLKERLGETQTKDKESEWIIFFKGQYKSQKNRPMPSTSNYCFCCYSVTNSVSDPLLLHEQQPTSLPCPSLSPRVCSNSYPLCPLLTGGTVIPGQALSNLGPVITTAPHMCDSSPSCSL